MKIAIVGAVREDSMEYHLADAFRYLNHNVEIFDLCSGVIYKFKKIRPYALAISKFLRVYSDKYDSNIYKELAQQVNKFNPDIVICFYRDIHPIFVDFVKTINRRVVHINPDQMTTLGYQQIFASNYDAWFTKDKYMLAFMEHNMKLNAYIYNEAFNHRFNPRPNVGKLEMEDEVGVDVMTYGTFYPYRNRMMRAVLDAGIDIKLYGVVPNRFYDKSLIPHSMNRYIVGDEKARVLYGSKIVLNNLHFGEVESVNCRFFEANGIGAFQLSDYRPILKELLPINPELVSFRTIDEGIDKMKYYLLHDAERVEIANVIYQHFIDHYTYDHLATYLLNIIESL